MSLEVVSFADFFGDNPNVAERSREVVEKIARTNANELSDAVDRLVGLPGSAITYLTVDNIRKLEYARLIEELTAKREAGQLNDTKTSSKDIALRGVKMVVSTNLGSEEFAEKMTRNFGGEPPKVSVVEAFDGRNTLEYLGIYFGASRFRAFNRTDPSGYRNDEDVIDIYGYLDNGDFNNGRRTSCSIQQADVVRLVTTGGDLWQNPNFTPAGLAIATASVD